MEPLTDRGRLEIANIVLKKSGLSTAVLDNIARFLTLPDAIVHIGNIRGPLTERGFPTGVVNFNVNLRADRYRTSTAFHEYLSSIELPRGEVRFLGQSLKQPPFFRYCSAPLAQPKTGNTAILIADFTNRYWMFGNLETAIKPDFQNFFSGEKKPLENDVFFRFT